MSKITLLIASNRRELRQFVPNDGGKLWRPKNKLNYTVLLGVDDAIKLMSPSRPQHVLKGTTAGLNSCKLQSMQLGKLWNAFITTTLSGNHQYHDTHSTTCCIVSRHRLVWGIYYHQALSGSRRWRCPFHNRRHRWYSLSQIYVLFSKYCFCVKYKHVLQFKLGCM